MGVCVCVFVCVCVCNDSGLVEVSLLSLSLK